MSVRSTNVYEEKSLGVYDDDESDDESEEEPDEGQFLTAAKENKRVAVWGRYLAWHARRQLAFGNYIVTIVHLPLLIKVQICGG